MHQAIVKSSRLGISAFDTSNGRYKGHASCPSPSTNMSLKFMLEMAVRPTRTEGLRAYWERGVKSHACV